MCDVLSRVANQCGMSCPGSQNCVGIYAQGGKPMWDVLSRVANMCDMCCHSPFWNVLTRVVNLCLWDVFSRVA